MMHEESLFFVDRGDGDTSAGLVYLPTRIRSVTDAARQESYEQGRDYAIDATSGRVRWVPGSRMPMTTPEELYAVHDPHVMIADSELFHRRQTVITYAHSRRGWTGEGPAFVGAQLPRTFDRLKAGQPLTVCVTGDSISEGYDASGFVELAPFQPAYPTLVHQGLAHAYGSRVDLQNVAVAGWTADHGVADVERTAATDPHLVIVAYGMNDASYAEPHDYQSNIAGIVDGVRRSSPEAEFVLVSPMLPNVSPDDPIIHRIHAYRDALGRLSDRGVVIADVTAFWTALLARKSGLDLTGNGVNHPNDFGHRIYAQLILSLLVEPHRLTAFEQK